MVDCIHYRGGYKYQLAAPFAVTTKIRPETEKHVDQFVRLTTDGRLEIGAGYAWDGPSGPTVDTPTFMRGSLVHDALYQLMRDADLDRKRWRRAADQELVRLCREDGMGRVRSRWVLAGVRWFAGRATSEGGRKPVVAAPHRCSAHGQPRAEHDGVAA
jgi:hypothetical protein